MRKHSFTLAEILVAMAIIGVVAALTVPSLSEAYKRRLLTTQLQRAYAEISQAAGTVMVSEMANDLKISKAIQNKNFIGKYLVVTNAREAFAPSYSMCGHDKSEEFILRENMSENSDEYKCGVTKAGASVCVDKFSQGILDINGDKSPNMIGRDAHQFSLNSNGTINSRYIDLIIKNNWDIEKSCIEISDPVVPETYNIVLTSYGSSKLQVIKAVKELFGLGLKEAKELVESAPVTLKEGVKEEEAEKIKKQLEEAGATITLEY